MLNRGLIPHRLGAHSTLIGGSQMGLGCRFTVHGDCQQVQHAEGRYVLDLVVSRRLTTPRAQWAAVVAEEDRVHERT